MEERMSRDARRLEELSAELNRVQLEKAQLGHHSSLINRERKIKKKIAHIISKTKT